MVDAVGTTRYTHLAGGALLAEDGPWATDTVSYGYQSGLRVALTNQQPTGAWTNGFGYDAARRLTGVTSPAGTFAYLYTNVAGLRSAGSLVARIALPNAAYITNTFDASARLLSTRLNNSIHTALNAHAYQLNAAHQRWQQTRTDGSTVTYAYDNMGQVIQALGSGGLSPENHGYGYDPAQNLSSRTNNGVTLFGVNNVNQLTTGPGGNYSYDANGNLASESAGRTFTYDAENQLTSVTYSTYYRTELVYDGRMRLRVRKEFTWMYSGWYPNGETRYVYDGMRVIQERNSGNTPTVSYTRGNDLSGSFEGAGGIGGLLARSDQYSGGAFGRHVYYHADGNGNVTMLVDSNQAAVATYRYDPFGRSLYAAGTLANANVYRFSSKELLASSGLYYYGYRLYEPNLQRWLNRDPIGEQAGANLYAAMGNSPLQLIDPVGLYERKGTKIIVEECEIVILYGHASSDPFCFELPSKCSAAGVVTCFVDKQLTGIPEDQRLPGQPSAGMRCHWGKSLPKISRQQIEKANTSGSGSDYHGDPALDDVMDGANAKADELFKCCDMVKISIIRNAGPRDKDIPTMKHYEMIVLRPGAGGTR